MSGEGFAVPSPAGAYDTAVGSTPPETRSNVHALVIGCGNLLCGDDAAGPLVVRRMAARGLPDGVECLDAGTVGIDVASRMRGVGVVVVVDACRSGASPGTIHSLPGEDLATPAPPSRLDLHRFRWDHALAVGRWLLGADYPSRVAVWLVEGACFDPGAPLSPPVEAAVDRLAERLCLELAGGGATGSEGR